MKIVNTKNLILSTLAVVMLATVSMSFNTTKKEKKVLRHVVSFQFNDDVSEERKAQAVKDFLELKTRIPEIIKFEGGEDISVEGFAKGFTHCYVLTFENEAARDIYLPHPAHMEVAGKNKPLLKDLFVFDYWGEE
ncbi:MAG: Dabb family protein [Cyclobacteriaceae bacterium]